MLDSGQGFEFLWLNSLLSWTLSWKQKEVKVSGFIIGSVTFK